ncbi:MAG: hypothetical protein WCJ61_03815, partial [Paludibacter sp.]
MANEADTTVIIYFKGKADEKPSQLFKKFNRNQRNPSWVLRIQAREMELTHSILLILSQCDRIVL